MHEHEQAWAWMFVMLLWITTDWLYLSDALQQQALFF
jgi:hypothetical protein